MVQSVVNKNIETKTSPWSSTDGIELEHNSIRPIEVNILNTTPGVMDVDSLNNGQRIGDEINIRGVSLKFMFELNERYSDVTHRIMVIRAARGDTVDASTIFNGDSGNHLMASFNKERFTLIGQKFFKIRAPNSGTLGPLAIGTGSGIYHNDSAGTDATVLSRATRMVTMWIPGAKFGRNGKITYIHGGTQPKFFDYHVVVFAYSNYSTSELLGYNVSRLNEYIRKVYYKDA